ncbi:MAG TPA: carboxypeptidase-like regulatory domain-containing protein, partial [Gemmatimonadaceae bacterium]|nr:carboxypeptidase-like regulatory domain-containing protein [Gemmatimonadaceae bacterium]
MRKLVLAALALVVLPALAPAQQVSTISGRVTAEGGQPLAGASVFLEGISVGSATDENGRYSFQVPAARASGQAARITARRIGYTARTVTVTLAPGAIVQDFVLGSNPLQLGEVVVTGAGTSTEVQKLGTVRNSVSADLIVRSNETNIVQALAGKAPNVNVAQSSGDPGAGSSIRIRGMRTLNGSVEPLFIVDGVPIDNSSVSTTNFN